MTTKLTKKPVSEIKKFLSVLHADISKLIEKAKQHVAQEFNSTQVGDKRSYSSVSKKFSRTFCIACN